ncbi:trypsin-like peptidase domain-containing protein [Nonomuraea sp. NPDC050556]|uniref:trypsin-like peptidase domain-containing protein n=1 Tax=Nonomuraea sp. NPDC050556 TaxID=3364369 RepID=UPI003790D68E
MHRSRRRVLAAAALAAAALTVSQAPAMASTPKDVATGTRLAARTNPAVQLIQQLYGAKVVVPKPKVNKAFKALMLKAQQNAKAGRIPADHQSQLKWALGQAVLDADRYLDPAAGQKRTKAEVTNTLCTGWWMTPNGYMVTGAHCVEMAKPMIRTSLGQKVLPKLNEADALAMLAQYGRNAEPTPEIGQLAMKLFGAFNTKHMQLVGLKHGMFVISVKNTATPLTLVAKGAAWPGEDFALLKMKGAKNLPTVSLGLDTDVRVGDSLYINGFPGPITFDENLDLRSRLYPTLTEGAYNAKRLSVKGVPYIQSQAPSYHGNSGGPVFSKDGKVIGILIAGTVDQDGTQPENHSFILPVSIVQKHLAKAGVKPVESATTRVYNSALDDFFAGRYRAALPKFRQVKALYPQHPYVGAFITDTQKAIAAGKSR